jgi:hypothetical protein
MRYTTLLLFLLAIAGWSANTTPVAPNAGGTDAVAIPQQINYQGKLTDNAGNPISDPWTGTFEIWENYPSGTPFWSGSYDIPGNPNGQFNVLLGSDGINGYDPILTLPEGQTCWLHIGVTIPQGQPTNPSWLSPLTQLVTVPYYYYVT